MTVEPTREDLDWCVAKYPGRGIQEIYRLAEACVLIRLRIAGKLPPEDVAAVDAAGGDPEALMHRVPGAKALRIIG